MTIDDYLPTIRRGDALYIYNKRYTYFSHYESFATLKDARNRSYVFTTRAYVDRFVPLERQPSKRTRKVSEFVKTSLPDRIKGEKNDCTVYALSLATGVDYLTAHKFMAEKGRKQGQGVRFTFEQYYSFWRLDNKRIVKLKDAKKYKTIGQWIKSKELPRRCILNIKGHVIPVIDNVLYDTETHGSKTRVYDIYEVINESSSLQQS